MDARKKNHIRDRRMIRNVKHELKNGPGRSQTSHDADEARRVRPGDTVSVDFFAWTEDGAMIECSLFDQPVTFTTGQHAVMKCLDELVIGMRVGESKTERIPPEQAFGPYRDELSCQVSTTWLRAQQVSPSPGSVLEIRKTNGMVIHMTITDVDGDRVTLDANHRLAGIPIILQLELLGIQDPAEIDLSWKDRSTL